MLFQFYFTALYNLINRYSLNLIVTIACIIFIYTFITRWDIVSSYASDIEGIEPNVIFSIQQLISGKSLYTNPEEVPYSITQYTPLYYYLSAYVATLMNLNSTDDLHEIYVIGRSISMIFNLFSVFVIFYVIKNIFNIDWKIALTTSIFSFIYQYRWNCSTRPDSMLNFFILLSVVFFLKYLYNIQHKQTITLIIAIFFSIISIFIKQSGIQLPIIFLSFLLITCQWKSFLMAFTLTVTFSSFFTFVFYFIYGQAFFDNTIGGIVNGIDLHWFIGKILYYKVFLFQVIMFAIVLSICMLAFLKNSAIYTKFISFCAVAMFIFATTSALKFGSTIHYYIDFQNIALITIVMHYLSTYSNRSHIIELDKKVFFSVIILSMLSLGVIYFYIDLAKYTRKESDRKADFEKQQSIANYIKHTLKINTDEYILTFGSRNIIIGNFLHHNFAMPQRDIVNCCSYPLNVFDYSNFRNFVESGKIKYYIIQKNSNETGVAAANLENFTFITDLEGFSIFKHNNYRK